MSKLLQDQYSLLLQVETEFAGRVVYLMRANAPRPWWHHLIPFNFLTEYFSLRKERRNFTEKHLYFKRRALDAAIFSIKSGDPEKSRQQMHSELRESMRQNQQPESRRLSELLGKMMDMLLEHYLRLIKTGELDYTQMLRRSYGDRVHYQNFLDEMSQLEREIDKEVVKVMGLSQLDAYMQNKQKAIREVRGREVRETF